MNQCKLVKICKWKYYKISHIHGMRFIWTKFISVTAISSLCFDNVINHEINQVFFSYLFHVHVITNKQVYCKIGHIDGIKCWSVNVICSFYVVKSIDHET